MSKENNSKVEAIISQYMSELGKRGGSRTTEKKVKSAVDNVGKARQVRQEKMQRWMREAAEAVTTDIIAHLQAVGPDQIKARIADPSTLETAFHQIVFTHISRSRSDESKRRKDWKTRHQEKVTRTAAAPVAAPAVAEPALAVH